MRDPADGPVPVEVVEGQGLVGRDLAARRHRTSVGQDVLDVDRVCEDDRGRLVGRNVDGFAAVVVVG